MASPYKIEIGSENTGLWNIKQSTEAARKATELLQKDIQNHHVFLNMDGFHDHMPHHILTLYGTGASVNDLQRAYDLRDPLQRPVMPTHESAVSDLFQSWEHASKYLGKEEHYPDFLAFFQRNMESDGYENVVNEYLLKADPAADELLLRLHAGVLHPLIQLMFGLEWKQPAIVAEALAQACVHGLEKLDQLLLESECRANKMPLATRMPAILSVYESMQPNDKIKSAVRTEDIDKIADGLLLRARPELLAILGGIKVHPDELAERTAEMFHALVLVASGAAIHPPHHVKYNFFLMHHINSALIYLTINKQSCISEANKVRMLEWKIRMDVIQYAARGMPEFRLEDIRAYVPKQRSEGSVRDIGIRLHDFGDDGHAIKQARATSVCHELLKAYQDRDWLVLKNDEIWGQIQHMVVDAVEGPGKLYVRSAGLQEAWKEIPKQLEPRRSSEELRSLQTGQ
ncbi:Oxidoreductase AflY 1 [Colletotrichum chlorophyti]|uniref:Oxidoreductase AflY 1 n=1 Tax=Colletotrichum chlorophyti TaxID=708187 RepID=A0A1Q8S3X7_9PEZI|nr:Oxidoreductase AflY 1 [Colletotrichum chlorophyti]